MINYFGKQRFSNNNADIGKAIVKKDFKHAVEFLLENKGEQEKVVKEYLTRHSEDYVGALKKLPKKLLALLVGAYQAKLWNIVAEEFSVQQKDELFSHTKSRDFVIFEEDIDIPIIGFGTVFKNEKIKKAYEALLREEKVTLRDFIIPQIPELSSEGSNRKLFVNVNDFSVGKAINDEFFSGKKKITIQFTLPPGSYATVFVNDIKSRLLNI